MSGVVLSIEASTTRPSAVLLEDRAAVPLAVWRQAEARRGTAALAAAVAELLADTGLAASALRGIAVGVGPGSYTGLRASIALARGIAFAAGLPVVGVASVAAAALAVLRERPAVDRVTVLVDARRGEQYRADYARAPVGCREIAPPRLVADADAETDAGELVREPVPDAYDVAVLGDLALEDGAADPAAVLPLYLKRSHAEIALQERAS